MFIEFFLVKLKQNKTKQERNPVSNKVKRKWDQRILYPIENESMVTTYQNIGEEHDAEQRSKLQKNIAN